MSLIAAGIAAGGALLGGGLSAISNKNSNKTNLQIAREVNESNKNLAEYQMSYNREMADLEYQRNLDMWSKTNAYNSPASQMARYQEAGLNPNLIYGQGTSGNAVGTPSYHAPRYERPTMQAAKVMPTLTQFAGAISDMARTTLGALRDSAQIKNLNEQTELAKYQQDKVKQDTLTGSVEQLVKGAQHMGLKISNEQKHRLMEVNIQQAMENLWKTESESRKINAEITNVFERNRGMQTSRQLTELQKRKVLGEIKLLKQTHNIRDFNQRMNEIGVNTQDPSWLRIITRAVLPELESLKGSWR